MFWWDVGVISSCLTGVKVVLMPENGPIAPKTILLTISEDIQDTKTRVKITYRPKIKTKYVACYFLAACTARAYTSTEPTAVQFNPHIFRRKILLYTLSYLKFFLPPWLALPSFCIASSLLGALAPLSAENCPPLVALCKPLLPRTYAESLKK